MKRATMWDVEHFGALGILLTLIFVAGCGGQSNGADDEIVSDCRLYLDALNRCTRTGDPPAANQRTAAAREAFTMTAKDEASREKLAARCRVANEQISRACR